MKTALEWYNEVLPDGYKELAIANYNNPDLRESTTDSSDLFDSIVWALDVIDFYGTPEGSDFWCDVQGFYEYSHIFPELPPLPNQ